MFTEAFLTTALPVGILVLISTLTRMIHLMLFERYFKLSFRDAPVWSLLYFGAWTAIVVFLFPNEMSALFGPITFIGYLLLVFILIVLFPFIYQELRTRVGIPSWLFELYPSQNMLSLEERYILAKIGDVLFQQCVAGAIILTLFSQGVSYPHIVELFVLLFILAHLYLFRTSGFMWGLHYTAYAALGGFAFPFLIIFVPGGIGYAIVLHMLFYVLSAAFFAKMPHPHAAVCRDCVGIAPEPK